MLTATTSHGAAAKVVPWRTAASMPDRRSCFVAAQIGGGMYVAGGMVGASGRYVLHLQRLDPAHDSWTRLPDMPREARAAAALVPFQGELWSIGGFDRAGNPIGAVWIYSPRTRVWRSGPELAEPLAMLGAVAAGGRIYAVSELAFERYEPGRGWRLGPHLGVPRHALGLLASAGRLWAIGGCAVPELADSRVVGSRPLG